MRWNDYWAGYAPAQEAFTTGLIVNSMEAEFMPIGQRVKLVFSTKVEKGEELKGNFQWFIDDKPVESPAVGMRNFYPGRSEYQAPWIEFRKTFLERVQALEEATNAAVKGFVESRIPDMILNRLVGEIRNTALSTRALLDEMVRLRMEELNTLMAKKVAPHFESFNAYLGVIGNQQVSVKRWYISKGKPFGNVCAGSIDGGLKTDNLIKLGHVLLSDKMVFIANYPEIRDLVKTFLPALSAFDRMSCTGTTPNDPDRMSWSGWGEEDE